MLLVPVLQLVLRTAPMIVLVLGWPTFLVFHVLAWNSDPSQGLPSTPRSALTTIALLAAHVGVMLLLQGLGIIRSAKSWAARQREGDGTSSKALSKRMAPHELEDDDVATLRRLRKKQRKAAAKLRAAQSSSETAKSWRHRGRRSCCCCFARCFQSRAQVIESRRPHGGG